jgi:hypothetical protein
MRKIGTDAEQIIEELFPEGFRYDTYTKGICKELGVITTDTGRLTEYFELIGNLRKEEVVTKNEFRKYINIYRFFIDAQAVDIVAIPKNQIYNLP